jgi:tetratricopeptide (TPR) repeat protein
MRKKAGRKTTGAAKPGPSGGRGSRGKGKGASKPASARAAAGKAGPARRAKGPGPAPAGRKAGKQAGRAVSAPRKDKGAAKAAGEAAGKGAARAAAKPAKAAQATRSLPEEIIEAVIPVAPRPEAVPDEDAGLLRNVMDSLTSIFGGKDFMSDAELDALLDSKIASGEIPPSAALDPLDEAQSLVYEAWNSEGPQRVRLARKALETSPDCADAYVILAEEDARDRRQALELYRKGMEAAERALDPALFRESAGRFWSVMETRPYMRARLGLAECLWEAGRREEALGHLRELLRLNPSDNQGVRYILAQVLLETGADEELGELLERFRGDASPQILYSHALWMFRREGRGRMADELLERAVRANPHVPGYLLKRRKPPREAPRSAGPGSEEEAAAYAMGASESWRKTLGASEWLAEKAS